MFVNKKNATPVRAIDGRSTHDYWKIQTSFVQLFDTQRHLLGSTDQQRGEADGVSVDLDSLIQDRIEGYLFAEIVNGIAVVAQNRIDQVFADIVYIAENGCHNDLAFRIAFLSFQEAFQASHGAFHDLGRLQYERQDQFAPAEAVAKIFHGTPEPGVTYLYGCPAL